MRGFCFINTRTTDGLWPVSIKAVKMTDFFKKMHHSRKKCLFIHLVVFNVN